MGVLGRGGYGEKWDNCNSIINKIYLKMKKNKATKVKISGSNKGMRIIELL